MSSFFFPGRTRDALTGQSIASRADAAFLHGYLPEFVQSRIPASRWVLRRAWEEWPESQQAAQGMKEALRQQERADAVHCWVDTVRASSRPGNKFWVLQDLAYLVQIEGHGTEELTALEQLIGGASSAASPGGCTVDCERADRTATLTVRWEGEVTDRVVLPSERLASWGTALECIRLRP